ncbi:MBL fold metallo-hydrolase [Paenibacillus turpanensis]|uniref:MBL fold metallo-hydrolase n=1 Tax=Paenibacillus turpanensis TaxID=2689078 RepID=UPI001407B83B|nr:MBL fold metallo-hydrolase [Paenibacillus turpanensis]
MLYAIILVLAFIVSAILFVKLYPAFGGDLSKEQAAEFKALDHFQNGRFVNQAPTRMDLRLPDMLSMLKDSMTGGKDRSPRDRLPVGAIDWARINDAEDSLTWFGHSAFLLSIDRKKLLVDPVFGPAASPVSFVGSKRYTGSLLSRLDELPNLDAVLITHDHYDHMDYPSIQKLQHKTAQFFVPLGVGSHLIRWGVPKEKITELDWWGEVTFAGITVAMTPSRHFSGRGIFNRDSTLWGGWVIIGERTRFYTSGDGGYGEHFKEIGKKYGPFDIALMEGGQYDRRWATIHMTPEEAVQAFQDVRGKVMMLIHWGAFTLAYHGWTDPVERGLRKAEREEVQLLAPNIGETVFLQKDLSKAVSPWWRSVASD